MLSEPAATARRRLTEALVGTGEQDRVAFACLYRLTSAKLFGICLRVCGSRQAAEDALQDVYLTVWRRAGGYDPDRSSPITWLATLARNRSIDWRRANPGVSEAMEEAADVAEPSAAADALIEADEGERALALCIDALADGERDAIRTAFFTGLTYAELAARKGVPIGTMKSRIRRALARLRACLDDA